MPTHDEMCKASQEFLLKAEANECKEQTLSEKLVFCMYFSQFVLSLRLFY